jgi:hypothetical protein
MVDRQQQPLRPNPDPSSLTTDALLREINRLERLFDVQLASLKELVDDIHGDLRAIPEQRKVDVVQLQIVIDEKFQTIREKYSERFTSIDKQLLDRDTRVDQTAKAGAEALAAALQAAKEAVGEQNKSSALSINKSEAATDKRIDQILLTIKGIQDAFQSAMDDLKERMNRYEAAAAKFVGAGQGTNEEDVRRRIATAATVNWLGLLSGIILAVAAIASFFLRHGS